MKLKLKTPHIDREIDVRSTAEAVTIVRGLALVHDDDTLVEIATRMASSSKGQMGFGIRVGSYSASLRKKGA